MPRIRVNTFRPYIEFIHWKKMNDLFDIRFVWSNVCYLRIAFFGIGFEIGAWIFKQKENLKA